MNRTLTAVIALLLVSAPAFAQDLGRAGDSNVRRAGLQSRQVDRGRYLVTIAACHDCHSPKIDAQMTPDAGRLLSGRPLTTP